MDNVPNTLNSDQLKEPFFNESPMESNSKKRQYSLEAKETSDNDNTLRTGTNVMTANKNTCSKASQFDSHGSWQEKRLKCDLMEANIEIIKLRQEIERLKHSHRESEIVLESKCTALKKQCDFSHKRVEELEKRIIEIRGTKNQVKGELLKLEFEMQDQKNKNEETIMKLQKDKHNIKLNAQELHNNLTHQLNKYKETAENTQKTLEITTNELGALKEQLVVYKSKMAAFNQLKLSHENLEQDLKISNSRIKDLESEMASYNDWKEITRNFTHNLLKSNAMNEELERLCRENALLKKSFGNVLLEEKIHDFQTRVDNNNNARSELSELQVHLKHVQNELNEWLKVDKDHCPPKALISPLTLRVRIEQILQNDVANEKATEDVENKALESALLKCKNKCEVLTKNVEISDITLKYYKLLGERIQKKLLLVLRELECYKQLWDNYEKYYNIELNCWRKL